MKKNVALLALALGFLCLSPASAQEKKQRLIANGVTVSLVNNGSRLKFYNEKNRTVQVEIVVYFQNGSSQLMSFTAETARGNPDFWEDFGKRQRGRIRPQFTSLPNRAAAISLPGA